jgi:hypothetical protein
LIGCSVGIIAMETAIMVESVITVLTIDKVAQVLVEPEHGMLKMPYGQRIGR